MKTKNFLILYNNPLIKSKTKQTMKKKLLILLTLMLGVLNATAQDPCTSITTITCGNNTTFATTAGNGDASYPLNVGSCNASSIQGGKEQIYSFTPTQNGTYEFEVTSVSGGFVQYLWKQANLGCDSTGWNCINRTNATGSIGAVNFVANTVYYILLNAEPTTALSQTFRVKCAKIVCSDILPLSCGVSTTVGPLIGYGDPNYALNVAGCNASSTQGGKEQIYSFTPTQTGTYEFSVTSASGGIAQYMWKPASLGCDNTGWNCINRSNSVESIGAVNFTANIPYYIMVNAEPTTSLTHIFMVKCVKIVCNDILPLTCATLTTVGPIIGYGDPNYPLNVSSCNGNGTQGGKEQIYSFTPAQTGTYEFEITSASGGIAQYMWKAASLGCNNTGWNCINRSSSVESIGAVNFTANTPYYILVNSETTASLTHIFRVKCVKIVCNDILQINCGTTTTFGPVIGYGDPNYALNVSSCSGSGTQGGKEQIYSFTPTQTGTYEFEVTSASGGVAQYMWKQAGLGCNNTGWTCINRSNSVESIGAVNFTANIPYYILVNSETTGSLTHIFRIKCAKIVCNDILPLTCGASTTFGPVVGYGDPDYALNVSGCNGSSIQGGKEQIYQLPASSTPYQIEITASSGGYMQYMWKPVSLGCNNTGWTCLARKNNTGIITTTIPASNTPIYLLVNAEPTSSITHVFTVTCTTLATNDFDFDKEIFIYPNPTSSVLNINSNNNITLDKVIITDLTGKIILEQTQNTSKINVENLSIGVYIVQVYSGKNKYQNKFIKQ
jgi:hypothetical protein